MRYWRIISELIANKLYFVKYEQKENYYCDRNFIRYNSQAVAQTLIPNVESAVVNFADPNVENEVREALKHAHLTDNPLNNPSLINRNLELRFIEQK